MARSVLCALSFWAALPPLANADLDPVRPSEVRGQALTPVIVQFILITVPAGK